MMSSQDFITKTIRITFLAMGFLGFSKITQAAPQDIPVNMNIADISNEMCDDMLEIHSYRSNQCPQALDDCKNILKQDLKDTIENYNENYQQSDPEDLFSGSEDLYKVQLDVFNQVIVTRFLENHEKAVIYRQGNLSHMVFVKFEYDTIRTNLKVRCLTQGHAGTGNTGTTPTNGGAMGNRAATATNAANGAPAAGMVNNEENIPSSNDSNTVPLVSNDSQVGNTLVSPNSTSATMPAAGGGCAFTPNGSSGSAWNLLMMAFIAIPALRRRKA